MIGVTASDNADVTASPATLTFTTANWDTAQTVTVSAAHDADAANDSASITHALVDAESPDEYHAVSIAGVSVTVTDDDDAVVDDGAPSAGVTGQVDGETAVTDDAAPAAVTVFPTALPLDEGASSTYTVVLDTQPASDVVIGVTASDNSAVTASPATLTFTTANWDTAQTVTVSAAHDADAANDSASITHAVVAASSPAEYHAATVDAATLTFTSSNWDTPKTVTVSAAHDADAANDSASITHKVVKTSTSDEYDDVSIGFVRVTVTDDDTAGVTVSATAVTANEGSTATYTVVLDTKPASNVVIEVNSDNTDVTALTVAEGGSAAYTVVLDAMPPSDVVITVTASGDSDVTALPATLTFTSSNWSTPKTVTVSASQDNDAANDAASISHAVDDASSADEYDAAPDVLVIVTVTDDDAAVTVSASTLTVAEGGNAAYTVVLDAQPPSDVVIAVSGSGDLTASPATLTFTEFNWRTAQTVTVSAAQDNDAANDTASITHAVVNASSANENAGVTVSKTTLTVAEGATGTFTVKLNAEPTSNVVISVTRSGSSDVTPSSATLTFTTTNWNVGQRVTVSAAEDADAANDAASISHAVDASSADEYDSVTVAGVSVTVDDNDTVGVTVSASTLTITEGGSSTYTVKLNTQPASDVVIGVTRSGDSDVTVSPATLTFTTSDWSTPKTVTVSAAEDADAANDAASITHAVDASRSADEYDAVTVAGVSVTVTDNENAGVTVSKTTLTANEGGSTTYTVVLDTQPASNVVIRVTRSGSSDVTVSPTELTFTTSDWSTPKTVTVFAAQDDDAVDDIASITHAVDASRSADEYDAVTVAGVSVSVTEDESAGVTVFPTDVTVNEGSTDTYDVVLSAQPTSNVVITVNSDNTDVTLSPATLTFTTASWSTPQTVTVSAAQDADAVNDAASITHAVDASRSANEYDSVSIAAVSVTVTDDDDNAGGDRVPH